MLYISIFCIFCRFFCLLTIKIFFPKNYRTVSNIQFNSKIIEKIVMKRIDEYLVSNNLYDPMQSTYKINHSTVTASINLYKYFCKQRIRARLF